MSNPKAPGSTASQRLQRPGFKIEEIRSEHHEFPSSQQGANSQNPPVSPVSAAPPNSRPDTMNLPPGHPLRVADVRPQNDPVQDRGTMNGDVLREQNGFQQTTGAPFRSQAETDPDFYTLGLLSQSKFYDGRMICARHIKGKHQAKFNKAAKESNIRYLVEAISATLGDGFSAFDLTPGDFYFLMYWQRISSFPKNPQIITSECTNDKHIVRTLLRTDDPEYLDPETLKIETFLERTTVDEDYLEDWNPAPYQELIDKYDLHVETMRDLVEFNEMIEEISLQNGRRDADIAIDVDEMTWLAGRAAFIRRKPGQTLQQRIDIVNEMDADEIQLLEEYIDAATAYGVKEYANLKCKDCGAHHRVKISIDALNFLPSNR